MKITLATPDEIKNWNKLLCTNPDGGEILQATAMAEIKNTQGWSPEYWVYDTASGKVYATALTRRFRGYGKLAYILRGPGVVDIKGCDEIIIANRSLKDYFAIKMEPPILASEEFDSFINKQTDVKKVRTIQPNANTILVDLTPNEDQILASFRQRARREIRQGDKEGVTVKQVQITDKTIRQMYKLYRTTAERAGFFIRPYEYYQEFWNKYAKIGGGLLFLAYQRGDDEPIAGAFICKLGTKALYKDGGSRRSNAKHFAHLLQWEIMRQLKSEGVTSYDLHGIPPADQLDNPKHPMAGLYLFKQSFSREPAIYVGTYDQIIKPKAYARWAKYGQRLHQALAHRIRKTTLY